MRRRPSPARQRVSRVLRRQRHVRRATAPTTGRRTTALAAPALLVAVGRGAVLPRLAGSDRAVACSPAPAAGRPALGVAHRGVSVASFAWSVVVDGTRWRRTSRPSPGPGSSALGALLALCVAAARATWPVPPGWRWPCRRRGAPLRRRTVPRLGRAACRSSARAARCAAAAPRGAAAARAPRRTRSGDRSYSSTCGTGRFWSCATAVLPSEGLLVVVPGWVRVVRARSAVPPPGRGPGPAVRLAVPAHPDPLLPPGQQPARRRRAHRRRGAARRSASCCPRWRCRTRGGGACRGPARPGQRSAPADLSALTRQIAASLDPAAWPELDPPLEGIS